MKRPATFIVACAPYHDKIVERAVESVRCQTIPSECIVVYDRDKRGAGWARNRAIEQVKTDFIIPLDADDFVEPDYVEATLGVYDGRKYVYTDWIEAGVVEAPECAWINQTWHVITSLLPTSWIRFAGGFDESLSGSEDTELFVKLTRSGLCGKRLARALFHYTADGQRGRQFVYGDTDVFGGGVSYRSTMDLITQRYGGLAMGCCQDTVSQDNFGVGQAQPGDVLATILREGSRQFVGSATGRVYKRNGNAHQLFMHPADIDQHPELFSRVVEMPPPVDEAKMAEFRALADKVMGTKPAMQTAPVMDVALSDGNAEIVPDVATILRLYENRASL
jgi:glycosyltransferase involved in cell wall biosynthesis